ncbi:hypothetical protein P154DRAFT_621261 [Amniculicola lignicola CBS 123094]|uniref:Uncharacterized protein n=1 Tax=Amniculicola lignicola CBS 123094 TaxID=1392246 RepID=A0A6A5WBD3_9PLEO|nr:hypothetical protein P154DRAFT_621261 [Amniculicola lignicola CBS 123094]
MNSPAVRLCIQPSNKADLNDHIQEKCGGCLSGDPPPQSLLFYIELQNGESSQATPQVHHPDDYEKAIQSVNNLRLEIDASIKKRYGTLYGSVHFFAHELLEAEDEYRALGNRYYRAGYHAYGDGNLSIPAFYTLLDAFHGRKPLQERAFFQPFADLESTIQSILRNSKDATNNEADRIQRLRKDVDSGRTLVISISRGLANLRRYIIEAQHIAEAMMSSGIGVPSTRYRNEAFWHWLSSLPETEMARRAGKEKIAIIRDALKGHDEMIADLPTTPPNNRRRQYFDLSGIDVRNGTSYRIHERYVHSKGLETLVEWEDDVITVVDGGQDTAITNSMSSMQLS